MPERQSSRGLSFRRILGFACNQGFVFFLFYTGLNRSFESGDLLLERVDLIGILLFMVIGFLLINIVSQGIKKMLTTRPALLLYALMLSTGSLMPYFIEEPSLVIYIVEALLVGVPCSFLLVAWGSAFGEVPTKISIPEVFLGVFFGAVFGLIVSIIPFSNADLAFRVLPFANALFLMSVTQPEFGFHKPALLSDGSEQTAALLSVKILVGTALFGMAAGFMETYNTNPDMLAMPSYPVAFLLLLAFILGVLSLLLSDGFGKGAVLNKAYRISIFILLIGFVLVSAPFFSGSFVSGEAIVLAGYLGLNTVLVSLFLVLANIAGSSTSVSFSRGFAALFGGELIGVVVSNVFNSMEPNDITPYHVVVLAAVLVLFSYIFLFTERDFNSLSEIVTSSDSFEDRCETIARRFSLSARETEILPYALKGRTAERISQELFITKSTVDTHLRRIYAKADVHSRQELIDLSENV